MCEYIGLDSMQSESGCAIFPNLLLLLALQELVNSMKKKTKHELSDNVTDNELVNKLTTENEQLKVSII